MPVLAEFPLRRHRKCCQHDCPARQKQREIYFRCCFCGAVDGSPHGLPGLGKLDVRRLFSDALTASITKAQIGRFVKENVETVSGRAEIYVGLFSPDIKDDFEACLDAAFDNGASGVASPPLQSLPGKARFSNIRRRFLIRRLGDELWSGAWADRTIYALFLAGNLGTILGPIQVNLLLVRCG